jgi:hypothetical protein
MYFSKKLFSPQVISFCSLIDFFSRSRKPLKCLRFRNKHSTAVKENDRYETTQSLFMLTGLPV